MKFPIPLSGGKLTLVVADSFNGKQTKDDLGVPVWKATVDFDDTKWGNPTVTPLEVYVSSAIEPEVERYSDVEFEVPTISVYEKVVERKIVNTYRLEAKGIKAARRPGPAADK